MPSKKIPDMPLAAGLDGTEEFHLVQGGNSRHELLSTLATWVIAQVAPSGISQATADARYVQQTNLNPTAVAPSGRIWTGGPSPRQYWRARFTGINGNAQPVVIAELQLRETVGTPQVPSGGAAVYSSSSGGQGPGAAFDGNINTVWQSAAQPTPAAPEWIGYNYGVGAGGPNKKSINEIAVTNTYNGVFGHVAPLPAEESPTAIDVQWSDDGATWTTEWSITGIAWTGAVSQTLVFTHPHAGQSPTATDNYPTTIAALNDVKETVAPTDGQVLKYVGADSKWEPKTPTLATLGDVSGAPTDGQVLTFVGADSKWEPRTPAAGSGGGGGSSSGPLAMPQLSAHRYWIVQWDTSRDFAFSVSELQFRATPGGANQTGTGTAIASDANNGAAANAFDGNTATMWGTTANGGGGPYTNPSWLGYDFGSGNAKVVQEVQISPRYDSAADQTPMHGRVMYSDDGVTYSTAWEFNFATAFVLATPRVTTSPWASSSSSGGVQLLARITSDGTLTQIDFASIPATYKHLRLVAMGRSARAATTDDMHIRLNGDTTAANYASEQIQGAGTAASAAVNPETNYHFGSLSAATATAGQAAMLDMLFPNYAGTTFNKLWQGVNSLVGYPLIKELAGMWNNTAAINHINIVLATGSTFAAGTEFSLYGMG